MQRIKTKRNFTLIKFKDTYNKECSLQKSSTANKNCIWIGLDEAEPMILAEKVTSRTDGWVKYPIHPDVQIPTRMHLSQEQIKKLLPILIHFAETGEI